MALFLESANAAPKTTRWDRITDGFGYISAKIEREKLAEIKAAEE
jgi:hypothetical protein